MVCHRVPWCHTNIKLSYARFEERSATIWCVVSMTCGTGRNGVSVTPPISRGCRERLAKKNLLCLPTNVNMCRADRGGNYNMDANGIITRMLAIETQVKEHENALAALRSEGQGLFGEFESWRLTFASSVAPKSTASKTDAKDDLKTGIKLAAKRAIQKAKDGASGKDVAQAAARRYVEKKGVELPTWVAEWTNKYIEKTYPQSQGETPAAEVTETKEIQPETTEAPKPTKKRKK